jgi:ribonuclease-3 family protein
MPGLTEKELDIIRRARNVKVSQARRADQAIYRLSTAFEALLGYLYLTDIERLKEVLALTVQEPPPEGEAPQEEATGNP